MGTGEKREKMQQRRRDSLWKLWTRPIATADRKRDFEIGSLKNAGIRKIFSPPYIPMGSLW